VWTLNEKLILLVEDHAVLRDMLVKMLTTLGYKVRAVVTADEAFALMSGDFRPDLLFTDIRTPGKHNGVDLARWVRKEYPAIAVLLQTCYAQLYTDEFPILNKPYSELDLKKAIECVLAPVLSSEA
jgi:CheY-like chemotaxis protein